MTKDEKIRVLSENLSLFQRRCERALEQRKIALTHIVSTLCESEEELSLDTLPQLYKSIVPDLTGSEEMLLYSEMARSHNVLTQMKAAFAIGTNASTPAGAHGKIACVKNRFNNSALDIFFEKINNAKALYVASFSEACDSIVEGKSEFCILPIENMTEGKMLGFYSMIDKFELKIRDVCDIEDEQSMTIRYALLAKGAHEPSDRTRNSKYVFEFSVLSEDGSFMEKLLSAADACKAVLISFDFSPVEYDSRLRRYLLAFRISGHDSLLFRTFLATNYRNYTPVGFYPEQQK